MSGRGAAPAGAPIYVAKARSRTFLEQRRALVAKADGAFDEDLHPRGEGGRFGSGGGGAEASHGAAEKPGSADKKAVEPAPRRDLDMIDTSRFAELADKHGIDLDDEDEGAVGRVFGKEAPSFDALAKAWGHESGGYSIKIDGISTEKTNGAKSDQVRYLRRS